MTRPRIPPQMLLIASYPVLVHAAVLLRTPALEWLALVMLGSALLFHRLARRSVMAWLALALYALAMWALATVGGGVYALYLPPLAISALMFVAFSSSLLPGRLPLVTRIAAAARGPLDAAMLTYTRSVTWLWALTVGGVLAVALVLTVFGPLAWWSLFTNFISYGLFGSVFLGEYLFRRWRFPDHDHPGFVAYLRIVASSRIRTG